MDKQLSGGPQEWDRPTYKVRGANITPDKETGIGNWSEADIKRAITNGTRPNGTPLAPIMPYSFYKVFTASDLDAVVAYVQSVAPVLRLFQRWANTLQSLEVPAVIQDGAMRQRDLAP
jgi:hypothetical protein